MRNCWEDRKPPIRSHKSRRMTTEAWLRCPWTVAGPGNQKPTRGLRGLTAPPHLVGGRHGACEAWLRCPWAVAGPGSQEREPAATHSPDQSSRRRLCSGHRMACPPARRPRRELRSARRLEARPGPAGPAAPSTRATLAQYVVVAAACLQTQPTHKRGRDRFPGHGLVDE